MDDDVIDERGIPVALVPEIGPVLAAPDPRSLPPVVVPEVLHRYVTDSLGRRYAVDEFGFRVRKSSRPPGIPPEVWNSLNAERKRVMIAEYASAPELSTLPPALPAAAPIDEALYDEISTKVETFLQSIDDLTLPMFTDRGEWFF